MQFLEKFPISNYQRRHLFIHTIHFSWLMRLFPLIRLFELCIEPKSFPAHILAHATFWISCAFRILIVRVIKRVVRRKWNTIDRTALYFPHLRRALMEI